MSLSKNIIDIEKSAYERWELPNVSDNSLKDQPTLPTAEEIEKIETAAYNEGLKAGHEEGLRKGQVEINLRCQQLNKILNFLQRPLDDLDEKVTDQLFHLAMTVTGQLIRRELHVEPGEVVAVVREAMASLPIAERKINIYLHPEDAILVRDALSLSHDDESQPWKVNEDPLLSRGGCRLQAGQSFIDASVETRLNRIIATLFGGERNSDLNVYADVSNKDEIKNSDADILSSDIPGSDIPGSDIQDSDDQSSDLDSDIDVNKDE